MGIFIGLEFYNQFRTSINDNITNKHVLACHSSTHTGPLLVIFGSRHAVVDAIFAYSHHGLIGGA